MGSIFKAKITRPMPAGATLVTRERKQWAEWRDASGKVRRAPTTGVKANASGGSAALSMPWWMAAIMAGLASISRLSCLAR